LHFIGIAGIGMSGMAEMLHSYGFDIQGSDPAHNDNVTRLKALGIKIYSEHDANNLEHVSHIVISSAIKDDNIELMEARKKNIPVLKRSSMLAELMRFKLSIAVSGAHGKTTTTSLIASMFENNDQHPSVINGGIINHKSTNAYRGKGNFLIVEADESDGTFILVPSVIAVITNIDAEHMDHYHNFDNLKDAYTKFINNLPFYGFAVVCNDHPVNREVAARIHDKEIIYYSMENEDSDVYAYNIRYTSEGIYYNAKISNRLSDKIKTLENVFLPIYGDHNILNSLAAIAIACKLDFVEKKIISGFSGFEGVKRRFNFVSNFNGAYFVDDYAHHPAEISATLKTANKIKEVRPDLKKVIAIVQPHRYSRLSNLFAEFANCYEHAEEVIVTNVYSAGEQKLEGFDSQKLATKIKENYPNKKVSFIATFPELEDHIYNNSQEGDLYILMGAGSISKFTHELNHSLVEKSKNLKGNSK
jgi:UDP-N-acetylmuramate--alanine ligase